MWHQCSLLAKCWVKGSEAILSQHIMLKVCHKNQIKRGKPEHRTSIPSERELEKEYPWNRYKLCISEKTWKSTDIFSNIRTLWTLLALNGFWNTFGPNCEHLNTRTDREWEWNFIFNTIQIWTRQIQANSGDL